MAQIRTTPTKQKAYLSGGVLQFRHPWLPERVLRFGLKKLPLVEHGEFLREAQTLLDRAPRTPREAPSRVRPALLDRYFKVIERATLVHVVTVEPDGGIPERDNLDQFMKDRLELVDLRTEVKALRAENGRLQIRVDELVRALNERADEEKTTTVRQCFDRFAERYQCQPGTRAEERYNVVRRVKCVLEHIGWEKIYAEIEKTHVLKAVEESRPQTEAEKAKRVASIKRFFRFLCLPRAEDGLGFATNPAMSLTFMGRQKLQQLRRNQLGDVAIFQAPETILPKLDLYPRALLAVLCYAGLRLAEAAALTWNRIDFEKRIIFVKPSDLYPQLKSTLSERPVKPFGELWPILEEFHAGRLHDKLVFPRPFAPEKTWFREHFGSPRIANLSAYLSQRLKAVGLADVQEPSRRARRFWETRMRSIGRTDLIPVMGGHSEKIGREHYTNALEIVQSLDDSRLLAITPVANPGSPGSTPAPASEDAGVPGSGFDSCPPGATR
jgi:integrase